jgi:hypothetical protein
MSLSMSDTIASRGAVAPLGTSVESVLAQLQLGNARVRADVIHARTSYTLADGREGAGRYTDVWARRDGRWLAVAAHVTRSAS